MIQSLPSIFLAISIGRSLCPRCTPSTSAAIATSRRSSMISGTSYFFVSICTSRANSRYSRVVLSFSRNCTSVTPPRSAASTRRRNSSFSYPVLSVIKYSVVSSFFICFSPHPAFGHLPPEGKASILRPGLLNNCSKPISSSRFSLPLIVSFLPASHRSL